MGMIMTRPRGGPLTIRAMERGCFRYLRGQRRSNGVDGILFDIGKPRTVIGNDCDRATCPHRRHVCHVRHHDERLRVIFEKIKPGYVALRAECT